VHISSSELLLAGVGFGRRPYFRAGSFAMLAVAAASLGASQLLTMAIANKISTMAMSANSAKVCMAREAPFLVSP